MQPSNTIKTRLFRRRQLVIYCFLIMTIYCERNKSSKSLNENKLKLLQGCHLDISVGAIITSVAIQKKLIKIKTDSTRISINQQSNLRSRRLSFNSKRNDNQNLRRRCGWMHLQVMYNNSSTEFVKTMMLNCVARLRSKNSLRRLKMKISGKLITNY